MSESKEELENLLEESALKNATVLILANKQDMPNSMSSAKITESMGIKLDRAWAQSVCATTGAGVNLGLEWLVSQIK